MELSRRAMLGTLGGIAAGTAVAGMVKTGVAASEEMIVSPGQNGHFMQHYGEFGWTPHKLDPVECAKVAYEGYWYKGYACGYGAFYGIIGVLAEKYGAPYNTFPFTMLEANKGGISNWGTICGALYGATAAMACFWGRKERDKMVTDLYRWYEQTSLPIYQPGDLAQGVKGDIPANPSGSVLCHISVSKWCYHTKLEATSKPRSERCGRITADVVTKAVEIINAKIDLGKDWKPSYTLPEANEYCGACHSKGNDANIAKGVMNCAPCHSGTEHTQNKFENHP